MVYSAPRQIPRHNSQPLTPCLKAITLAQSGNVLQVTIPSLSLVGAFQCDISCNGVFRLHSLAVETGFCRSEETRSLAVATECLVEAIVDDGNIIELRGRDGRLCADRPAVRRLKVESHSAVARQLTPLWAWCPQS